MWSVMKSGKRMKIFPHHHKVRKMLFAIVLLLCTLKMVCSVDDKDYASMPALFHLDDYDHCMLNGDDALYCMVKLKLKLGNPNESNKTWNIIRKVSKNTGNYRHDILRHGLCINSIYSNFKKHFSMNLVKRKLRQYYDDKYDHLNLKSDSLELKCETDKSPYDIYNDGFVVTNLILVYVTFVILVSTYDFCKKEQTKTFSEQLLFSFSIRTNWRRLTTVNTENDSQKLKCIQGLRFYLMILVLCTNTMVVILGGPIMNTKYVESMNQNRWWNVYFPNRMFIMQIYFLISAWLLAYGFCLKYETMNEKFKIKHLFLIMLVRLMRLIPVMAILIHFYQNWFAYFHRGPLWDSIVGVELRNCKENAWTNLLFSNIFINKENMCLNMTWYLALDTYYFALAIILLWVVCKYKQYAQSIFRMIIMLHLKTLFTMIYQRDYFWNYIMDSNSNSMEPEYYYNITFMKNDKWHKTFIFPYGNFCGYLVGLCFGFAFYKYREQKLFTKKSNVFLWWIAILGIPALILLTPGITVNYTFDIQSKRLLEAVYGSLGRYVFSAAIGLGILGCTQGLGGVLRRILEWKPLYVLGRLNYSAYLIQKFYLQLEVGMSRAPLYLNGYILAKQIFLTIIYSYAIATVLTLFFEMPITQLIKILMQKEQMSKNTQPCKNIKKQ